MKKYIGEILISVIIWILGVELCQQHAGLTPVIIFILYAVGFIIGISFIIKELKIDLDKEEDEDDESDNTVETPKEPSKVIEEAKEVMEKKTKTKKSTKKTSSKPKN